MKITETPDNDNNLPSFSELLGAGNIVPNIWYHKLKRDTGKSDSTAISILSELVFLYRCNNATEFQLNFKYFKKKFNFGLSQVKDAVVRLEKLGLVTRSLRTVSILDRSFANEMFLVLNINNVLKLNEGSDLKKFPKNLRNDDTSSGGSSLMAEDKTVKSQSLPRNCPDLSAEISAGNNIDNNNKKSIDRFNRSSESELKVLKEEKEETADNALEVKKAQEANINAKQEAKELKSCTSANSIASSEPCNISQAEIAKEQSKSCSKDLPLAPSSHPTEPAEQSSKSTPIWLKFQIFGKKLAEFYPLTEQDRDWLAEKSGRKFELHFINQLLLKISNQHPEYKFCHKKSVLNYMAKALAYELREVEMANKGCFKFKSGDRNTEAHKANSNSLNQDPSTPPAPPPSTDSIWGKIRIKLTQQLENGEALDRSWFSKLVAIYDHDKKHLTLKAPSNFIRDRIAQQYGYLIEKYSAQENYELVEVLS